MLDFVADLPHQNVIVAPQEIPHQLVMMLGNVRKDLMAKENVPELQILIGKNLLKLLILVNHF